MTAPRDEHLDKIDADIEKESKMAVRKPDEYYFMALGFLTYLKNYSETGGSITEVNIQEMLAQMLRELSNEPKPNEKNSKQV